MVRKAEYIEAEDIDTFEVITSGQDKTLTSQQMALGQLLDQISETGDSATVTIYRQNGGGKSPMVYLDSYPADKYPLDELTRHIRDTYGTGDYRIHVRVDGQLRGNKLISVETPKLPQSTNGFGNELAAVIEAMQNQTRQIVDMLQQNHQPQQSRMDMLQEMLLFKQLFDRPAQSDGLSNIRETLGLLSELGLLDKKPEEKEAGFMDQIAAPLGTLLNSVAAAQAAKQQQRQHPIKRSTQNRPDIPEPKMNMQQIALKMGMSKAVEQAAKNNNPKIFASWLAANIPGSHVDSMLEMLESDAWFENICALDNRAKPYRAWFERLKSEIESLYYEPDNSGDSINEISDNGDS